MGAGGAGDGDANADIGGPKVYDSFPAKDSVNFKLTSGDCFAGST